MWTHTVNYTCRTRLDSRMPACLPGAISRLGHDYIFNLISEIVILLVVGGDNGKKQDHSMRSMPWTTCGFMWRWWCLCATKRDFNFTIQKNHEVVTMAFSFYHFCPQSGGKSIQNGPERREGMFNSCFPRRHIEKRDCGPTAGWLAGREKE